MIKICFPLPSGIKRWEDQDMVKIIFLRLCSTKIELRFFRVMRSQQQVVLTLKAAGIFLSTFNGYWMSKPATPEIEIDVKQICFFALTLMKLLQMLRKICCAWRLERFREPGTYTRTIKGTYRVARGRERRQTNDQKNEGFSELLLWQEVKIKESVVIVCQVDNIRRAHCFKLPIKTF